MGMEAVHTLVPRSEDVGVSLNSSSYTDWTIFTYGLNGVNNAENVLMRYFDSG